MTIFKGTLLFKLGTGIAAGSPTGDEHIGGWTESIYGDEVDIATFRYKLVVSVATGFLGFATYRATLLPPSAAIIGYRIAQLNPRVGRAQVASLSLTGISTSTDIPQMALLSTVNASGAGNVRRWTMRGIPDNQVVNGEFSPDPGFAANLGTYYSTLQYFKFPGRDLTQPAQPIATIDQTTGIMTMSGGAGFAVNDVVRIKGTRDVIFDNLLNFTATITAIPVAGQYKITPVPAASTVGGTATKITTQYFSMLSSSAAPSRITTRKVGRPFGEYRGRRAKKRSVV